ncbi:MAG TPA: MBOAT family O-acyltransferase [Planctomycetota bacterium]|nr:MBOAT family O-acyltransferase [Planctomycetota bacterium]
MLFSSAFFLFAFLPVVLALCAVLGPRAKNLVLLVASLIFYAWGESWLAAVMAISIVANHGFGLWVERERRAGDGRVAVTTAVVFNLGLLVLFKYADWIWESAGGFFAGHAVTPLGALLVPEGWGKNVLLDSNLHLRLPLGISFFTFQAMSYVIDVHRRDVAAQRSLLDFGLYITFFPQLIAGPIVRYRDLAGQIVARTETLARFASGVRRFAVGLGKKILIANTLGAAVEQIFSTPPEQVTLSVAWLGALVRLLHIYFDFSSYSDMAIGLGRMFGFEILENFNYPFLAKSLSEFWRRWHISLSTWFRDYLYIPLGGGRGDTAHVYSRLAVVFLLCGLWHGASLNFLVFGCIHGTVLALERAFLHEQLKKWPTPLRRAYLFFVLAVGGIAFQCEDTQVMSSWFAALFGFSAGNPALAYPALYLDPVRLLAIAAAIIGSMPWIPWLRERLANVGKRGIRVAWLDVSGDLVLGAVLLMCALELSVGTFDPFVYFRF